MAYRVPFVDPQKHYSNLKAEIDAAITDCLSKGDLILRSQLEDFEKNFASLVGTKYAEGLNSGYHALALSLLAAGIGAGDEVITVAHTFVATISAIVHCGATPVLIDVGKDYNMDMEKLESAITPNTKAVLPVHLNGRLCDMDRLMDIAQEHNLIIIEDAAQSVGGKYNGKVAGSFGLAGCFSHYPFKILGGFGDGGTLTTNDPDIARKVTLLRYNGEDRETGEYFYHGYTCLLDNIQAAVLDVKLKHLPEWIKRRRAIAELYRQGLSNIEDLFLPHFEGEKYFDVYQNYVSRTKKRDELYNYLEEQGVETLIHWKRPVWEHKGLKLGQLNLPETESICKEVISLPMSAETTDE
ncbi:MAG: DegT/DnrJ/EryC1/StrS family aminotransferase, partial [Candidatus Aminicenantaceae bacterium]